MTLYFTHCVHELAQLVCIDFYQHINSISCYKIVTSYMKMANITNDTNNKISTLRRLTEN